MSNIELTDELMQDIYDEAVSAECFERRNVDSACFDLLCKMDEAGGLSHVVRVLIDMARANQAELQEYRKELPAVSVSDEFLSAMEEVLRISDRDHEAWHRARAGINSCRAAMHQGADGERAGLQEYRKAQREAAR